MEKTYTAEQVLKHNKEIDIWLTLDGGVYNMTEFLSQHPGGEEVLLKLAGQDGTECFNEVGHSSEAKQLRESFRIGRLEGSPYVAPEGSKVGEEKVEDEEWAYVPPKNDSHHSFLPIIIGLGVIIYGYIFTYIL